MNCALNIALCFSELYLNPVYHIHFFHYLRVRYFKASFFVFVFDIILYFFSFLRLHIPTAFFLFPQAPSQSDSEPEKALLCNVPPPPPSAFAEMSGDRAQSSASKISEDVDKEDEFGYSWSKLSFRNAFDYKRY